MVSDDCRAQLAMTAYDLGQMHGRLILCEQELSIAQTELAMARTTNAELIKQLEACKHWCAHWQSIANDRSAEICRLMGEVK